MESGISLLIIDLLNNPSPPILSLGKGSASPVFNLLQYFTRMGARAELYQYCIQYRPYTLRKFMPRLFSLLLLLSIIVPNRLQAHGGEDHSAPTKSTAPPPSSVAAKTGFSTEGAAFQAVLVLAEGKTILYLADIDTNAPVAGATIEADIENWQGSANPTSAAGVYELAWTPSSAGGDVTLIISAGGKDDLLLIAGVHPHPPPNSETGAAFGPAIAHWTHWAGGGAIGAIIVAILLGIARRRHKKTAVVIAILALLTATAPALAHGGEDHSTPQPAQAQIQPGQPIAMSKPTQFLLGIRTEKIEAREAADTVRVVGRVIPDPAGYARIQPSQSARVISDPAYPIPIPGAVVKKGQVLIVLEPTLTNLERGDKRSSLSRIESQVAITERELARQEKLGALVPAKQIETTRIQLEQLRRERGQISGTSLGREFLIAPVDGVVADVHVVPGEVVGPAQIMIEVVDPSRLQVEAVIHDLTRARNISGAKAATKLLPGQIFSLTLLGSSPKIDPLDLGIHAIFQVAPEQSAALNIGMPVDVYLATGTTRLLTAVPRDAITEMGGRQVVFVRTAPEIFEARPVKVERIIGPLAEIAEGVNPGERVVTQGIEQLRAGK
jgi:RND family efflux transporter MFP subunit